MEHFETAMRCAVQLVLKALNTGSHKLLDTIDCVLDLTRPIYSFKREANAEAHRRALELRSDCEALWEMGGGEKKRSVMSLHRGVLASFAGCLQENGLAKRLVLTLHKHSMTYWKNVDGPESLPAGRLLESFAISPSLCTGSEGSLFQECLDGENDVVMHDVYACLLPLWSLLPHSVQDSAFADLSKTCKGESKRHKYLKTVLRKV